MGSTACVAARPGDIGAHEIEEPDDSPEESNQNVASDGPTPHIPAPTAACDVPADAESADTGITFVPQQALNWCWAAVSKMIGDSYGEIRQQCELASIVGHRETDQACCEKGANATPECDFQSAPFYALRDIYGLNVTETDRPLTAEELRAELANSRSVVIAYRRIIQSTGLPNVHIVVVTAYGPIKGEQKFTLLDPMNGEFHFTYDGLLHDYPGGHHFDWVWHHSTYNIEPESKTCGRDKT
jgi:hypothetical protein